MRTKQRKNIWIVSLLFLSAVSQASLRPTWMKSSDFTTENETFLSNLKKDCQKESEVDLITDMRAQAMRQSYDDMVRDFEFKDRYSITDLTSQYIANGQKNEFSRSVFGEVRSFQRTEYVGRFKSQVKRDESLKFLTIPILVAATVASAYGGKPIMADLNLASEVDLHAESVINEKKAKVFLRSPVVDSAIHVQAGSPSSLTNPVQPLALDLAARDERYRFSVSKSINSIRLTPGLEYGSTSSTVSASLSKELAPHLQCTVETIRPVDGGQLSQSSGQERVRFGYALQF